MADRPEGYQGPTSGKTATAYADLIAIVMHPAFRIGFLDAKAGRFLDHDRIRARIAAETPERAFERMGMPRPEVWPDDEIPMAQLRYEEGRLFFLEERPKVRGWGHPDYPPAAVYDYLSKRCKAELEERGKQIAAQLESFSVVDAMRRERVAQLSADQLPLFVKPIARAEAS